MFHNSTLKQILEGSLGGRRPNGKLKNRREGRLQEDATKLLNMKNWHAVAKRRTNCRRKTGGRKWPQNWPKGHKKETITNCSSNIINRQ
jgi:hypothetical protein